MRKKLLSTLVACFIATSSQAQNLNEAPPHVQDFVAANLLSTFYHELAHALIHILQLPVFGQEEDAADVASVLLINALYEEDAARQLAYDTAFGFWGEAEEQPEPLWWDTHGPDLQRYYNIVCLFYGANPDERDDLAEEMGLPLERAEGCEEEFELAQDSWGPVFDQIETDTPGSSIQMIGSPAASDAFAVDLIAAEIEALNTDFQLPETLHVTVEPCGEPNAFYDLDDTQIIICSEFAPYLAKLTPKN